ncbi:MAG: GTP-binding protein [Methylococcus sp.]|nr:MAG: GTP-binding protein [Methylococcus sp.]
MSQRIPFTIITGFLGAGKTTLLKRLLIAEHGHRLAVIMNEFGEISIDSELVQDDVEDGIVEMKNGCVCCEIREDLVTGITQLLEKRRAGTVDFDHIVMETTGLANPGPIAQTLGEGVLKELVQLDGVVTVVDAYHAQIQLDEYQEIQEQIGVADIIVLNKIDLVDSDNLAAVQHRLAGMNTQADIHIAEDCNVEPGPLLQLSAHSLDKLEKTSHARTSDGPVVDLHRDHENHTHLEGVHSISIEVSEPLVHDCLMDWFTFLIIGYSDRLLRYKGILNFKDRDERIVFQGMHSLFEARSDREWRADETRSTRIVFIGKDLPEDEIRQGIQRCIAADQAVTTLS